MDHKCKYIHTFPGSLSVCLIRERAVGCVTASGVQDDNILCDCPGDADS